MFYSVFSLVLAFIMGLLVGDNPPEGTERLMVVVMGPGMLYLLVMTLYCIGQAIDLPKSEAKPLWIIGILFATPIAVPYFYFKHISKRFKST